MAKRIMAYAALFALFCLRAAAPQASRGAAADAFAAGEDLFRNNKPAQAIGFLEDAIGSDPSKEMAYLYLGVAYMQTGKTEDAISVLKRGQAKASDYPYLFSYNLGTCYFVQGKNSFADDMYSKSISLRPDYAPAWLNRANARMNLKRYPDAAADYAEYLSLEPATPQRPSIEKVIKLIGDSIAEADKKKAEEDRKKAEEEARKARLLSDVEDSLKQAAAQTQSISAGAEGAQGYDSESELAD
jgi:tetratricopeptide (TPR) repeat protein